MKHDKILPLTGPMKKLLEESYNREINSMPPLGTYYTQSAKGLFQRGFLNVEECTIDGRLSFVFRITDTGKKYLESR